MIEIDSRLLISAIVFLSGAIGALFFLYRRSNEETAAQMKADNREYATKVRELNEQLSALHKEREVELKELRNELKSLYNVFKRRISEDSQ